MPRSDHGRPANRLLVSLQAGKNGWKDVLVSGRANEETSRLLARGGCRGLWLNLLSLPRLGAFTPG